MEISTECSSKISAVSQVAFSAKIINLKGLVTSENYLYAQAEDTFVTDDTSRMKAKASLMIDARKLEINGQVESEKILKVGNKVTLPKGKVEYSVNAINVAQRGILMSGTNLEINAKELYSRGIIRI